MTDSKSVVDSRYSKILSLLFSYHPSALLHVEHSIHRKFQFLWSWSLQSLLVLCLSIDEELVVSSRQHNSHVLTFSEYEFNFQFSTLYVFNPFVLWRIFNAQKCEQNFCRRSLLLFMNCVLQVGHSIILCRYFGIKNFMATHRGLEPLISWLTIKHVNRYTNEP